ncbi:MAG: hypothetical protein AB1758_36275 [Candidatus Eremiobacterota bacterium]
MDPDNPDLALNLARDLRQSNPECAEVLSGWAAETYPELFDAHAELAELAREKGDWERPFFGL